MKLDYEDFLRQRGHVQWDREHPLRQELVDRRFQSADEVAYWVVEVSKRQTGQGGLNGPGGHENPSGSSSTASIKSTKVYPALAANAALVLIVVACSLLNRQVARLAADFENKGGFSERLHRVRSQKRGY